MILGAFVKTSFIKSMKKSIYISIYQYTLEIPI
jgi:hypothetical protein